MSNVCKFLPPPRTAHQLQTINFVYEKHPQGIPPCPHTTVYRVHLVTSGEGTVHLGHNTARVKRGDVFFSFPALPFHVEADRDLQFMYISYIGVRAAAETERCGVRPNCFVFNGLGELEPLWLRALQTSEALTDLAAESVLLGTLATIGSRTPASEDTTAPTGGNFALVKAYIDENFCTPTLCINDIADRFSYNKKYISTLFKKQMKVSVSEYIRTLRLNRAAELLEKGALSITEIAHAVGFGDALYFSKLFKQHTGCSPKQYREKK